MSPKKFRPSSTSLSPRPLKLWLDTQNTQDVRIEIVPLIDIIFCVLTFFILAAVGLSRQQAINLDLPRASTGTPQMREMLVISLDDFAQVYVGNQAVQNQEQLQTAVQDYLLLQPNGLVVLRAARNANYNDVVNVIDTLRKGGTDRISLATIPGSGEEELEINPNPFPGTNLPTLDPNIPLNLPSENDLLNPLGTEGSGTSQDSTPTLPIFPISPDNDNSQSEESGL